MVGQVPENPFWDFSLNAYDRSGVAEACLALQERHGLDVNLLLFAAWAGYCGRRLSAEEMAEIVSAAAAWHSEVVRPLRAVRSWLKGQATVPDVLGESLRGGVKAMELQAEMLQQLLLHQYLPLKVAVPDPRHAAANMRLYLTTFAERPSDSDVADLAVVLRGACPDVTPLEAIWSLGE